MGLFGSNRSPLTRELSKIVDVPLHPGTVLRCRRCSHGMQVVEHKLGEIALLDHCGEPFDRFVPFCPQCMTHVERLRGMDLDEKAATEVDSATPASDLAVALAERELLRRELADTRERLRIAEAVRDDARAASARDLERRRAAEYKLAAIERGGTVQTSSEGNLAIEHGGAVQTSSAATAITDCRTVMLDFAIRADEVDMHGDVIDEEAQRAAIRRWYETPHEDLSNAGPPPRTWPSGARIGHDLDPNRKPSDK